MKSHLYLYEISRYLATFVAHVQIENRNGKFDINKHAEGFLVSILNIVFKKEFQRLEFSKVNFPAIDLRSKDSQISIQVTSEKGFRKIRETLSSFIKQKLFEESSLIHVIIDAQYRPEKTNAEIREIIQEEAVKAGISEYDKFEFGLDNIWNISDLQREIEKSCGPTELKQIRDILNSEYPEVSMSPMPADILIPYEIAFESQIKVTPSGEPSQFANPFIGRQHELISLREFIDDTNRYALTIVADGGFGKTRLAVEFFQKVIDPLSTVSAFVLNDAAFSGDLFVDQTNNFEKVIVLVDDAHRKTEILDSVLSSAKRHGNVKVIMTVRNALYEDTIRSLPTHSRNIISVPLKRFSYDNTVLLIQSQLPGLDQSEQTKLADQSKGVPMVVLALCQMIKKGKYSSQISEEDNFIRFVRELKDQVISDISVKYYLDRRNISKVIQLISLVSPLQNSEEEIRALSDLNSMSFEETSVILTRLEDAEFIRQKREISIISDPYSDIILLDTAPRIPFILKDNNITRFLDRVIRNLVEVDHSDRLRLNVDSIVEEFIRSIAVKPINTAEETNELKNNLETLIRFTYKKPRIALKAIELILKATEKNSDFWAIKKRDWNTFRLNEINEEIDTILSIVAINMHGDFEIENVYNTVLEISRRRADFKVITKAFRYREYDFVEYGYRSNTPCERQLFLVKQLLSIVAQELINEFDIQIIMIGVACLMQPELSREIHYNKYKHTFSHGAGGVPDNELISAIRKQCVEILIELFKRTRKSTTSNKIFDEILRTLHFVTINDTSRNNLNRSIELRIVEKFLFEHLAGDPTVEEKALIVQKLRLYSIREIKSEYSELYKRLMEGASYATTNRDKIELLLREEYFFKKQHIQQELKKCIALYTDWKLLFQDAIEIRKNLNSAELHHFNDFLIYLIDNHPDRSKEMFDFIIATNSGEILTFCELIRANYKDKKYFESKIQMLWAMGTPEAQQAVIYLLTFGRNRDKSLYEIKDFDFIETVVNEGNQAGLYRLVATISDFMDLDPNRTINICKTFITVDKGRNTEMLILSLFEDEKFTAKHKDVLKEFVFSIGITLLIDDHYFNQIFLFLEKNFGFEVLFSFLLKRMEYDEKGREAWSMSLSSTYNNPTATQETKEGDFIKVIDWYIAQENPSKWFHLKLVEFFLPRTFSISLMTKLEQIVKKNLDLNYLLRLCEVLDAFDEKTDELLRFLVFIANTIVKLNGYKKEHLVSVFGQDFLLNMGSRNKVGPGPFPRDLERQELLSETLKTVPMEADVMEILQLALKRVQQSIKNEENDETADW